MEKMSVERKIERAKAKLLISNRFFGSLLMAFPVQSGTIGKTAYTDGIGIFYNPKFIEKLSPDETIGVLLHELFHNFFKHFQRFNDLKRYKYHMLLNVAEDYAINSIIINEMKKITLPKEVLYKEKYKGLNAEKIYKMLLKDNKKDIEKYEKLMEALKNGAGKKCDKCNGSGSIEGKNGKPQTCDKCNGSGKENPEMGDKQVNESHGVSRKLTAENVKKNGGVEKAVNDIDSKIHRAYNNLSAKEKGDLPESFKRLIDDYLLRLKGKINWKRYIINKMMEVGKDDYTMQRYNRRYVSRGIYLPSTASKKSTIAMALDTSGSIGEDETIEFISEIKSVLKMFKGMTIHLFGCDAELHGKLKIKGNKQFKVKDIEKALIGGGGTSHMPIFKEMNKNMYNTKLLFCFTDGYSDINEIPKNMRGSWRTYWILPESSKDLKFDFGTNIIIYNGEN